MDVYWLCFFSSFLSASKSIYQTLWMRKGNMRTRSIRVEVKVIESTFMRICGQRGIVVGRG